MSVISPDHKKDAEHIFGKRNKYGGRKNDGDLPDFIGPFILGFLVACVVIAFFSVGF